MLAPTVILYIRVAKFEHQLKRVGRYTQYNNNFFGSMFEWHHKQFCYKFIDTRTRARTHQRKCINFFIVSHPNVYYVFFMLILKIDRPYFMISAGRRVWEKLHHLIAKWQRYTVTSLGICGQSSETNAVSLHIVNAE